MRRNSELKTCPGHISSQNQKRKKMKLYVTLFVYIDFISNSNFGPLWYLYIYIVTWQNIDLLQIKCILQNLNLRVFNFFISIVLNRFSFLKYKK